MVTASRSYLHPLAFDCSGENHPDFPSFLEFVLPNICINTSSDSRFLGTLQRPKCALSVIQLPATTGIADVAIFDQGEAPQTSG